MPALLHDPAVRRVIRSRVEALGPNSVRRWGEMSIDQMLWHINQSFEQALGRAGSQPVKEPLPAVLMRFVVLNVPWPKGSPTAPELVADGARHDFDVERARCLELIDVFAAKRIDDSWPISGSFGKMTGRDWSRLQAKHLDHHLRQFSA
jgi:hypothetical protein